MSDTAAHDVTRLLVRWRDGDDGAFEQLVPVVHDHLCRLARRHMAGQRPDHILQPTALANEAYLRLGDTPRGKWRGRAHFLALAAGARRRVLVDRARAQKTQRRGGG